MGTTTVLLLHCGCCTMGDEGDRELDWTCRDEEEDAYASDDYYRDSGSRKKKRRLGKTVSSSTTAGGGEGAVVGYDREAPLIADAFRGHYCPICLGSIQDSAMIGDCRHLYCKTCLFEVRAAR